MIGIPEDKEQSYYWLLSKIESNDNPKAKAKTSSASGRFQFIKSTWEGLGYAWKDVFNDSLQWQAIKKLTAQNARILENAGCAINFATLYGAHFLGPAALLKVMRAAPSDPITKVTTAAQRRANPTILKGTVKDFCDWLERKTGDSVYKRYTTGGWNTAPKEGQPPDTKIPVDPVVDPKSSPVVPMIGLAIFVAIVLVVAFFTLGGR